jgi:hypothetical protein
MSRHSDIKTASLLVAFAALVGSASILAAEIAERPEWKVGDKWTFRATENPGAKETTWTREVMAAMPNGNFQVQTEDGKNPRFDNEGNSLDRRGPEYSWRRFKFPMSVGMSWDHEHKIAGDTWTGTSKSSWHVRAFEKITVPAGTFDCFKVEGETYGAWNAGGNAGYTKSQTRTTYWYCPAVKWAAKWEIENIAYVTAPRVVTVSELVSFDQKH